jgi:hypothetical protein
LYLCAVILKNIIMALEIKSPPVLEGKAAREFYRRWAEAKCSTSKEAAQASMRKSKAILADYYKKFR